LLFAYSSAKKLNMLIGQGKQFKHHKVIVVVNTSLIFPPEC